MCFACSYSRLTRDVEQEEDRLKREKKPEKVKQIVELKTNLKQAELDEIRVKLDVLQGQKEAEIKRLVQAKIKLEHMSEKIQAFIKKKRRV